MVRARLLDELNSAGYKNVRGFADGLDAWQYLTALQDAAEATPATAQVAGIITDVEMPRMDGLTLTRKIRQHPVWKSLPVLVFS
jgi:two-component system chemotaxis response regulator CheV